MEKYVLYDYEQWEENSELIRGGRVLMEPAPAMGHQRIATRLTTLFSNQLKDSSRCSVYQPLNYRIADDTVLQPDMLVVKGESGGLYLDSLPVLVAEILSPSTADRDRTVKFSLYESQGVFYYLIISPAAQEVEIYQWEDGKYLLKTKGRDIRFTFDLAGDLVEIDFSQIW